MLATIRSVARINWACTKFIHTHTRCLSASHIFSRFGCTEFHWYLWLEDVWKEMLGFCGNFTLTYPPRERSAWESTVQQVASNPRTTSLIVQNDGKYVFVQVVSHDNVRHECKTHGACTSDPHKLSFINFIKFATHTYFVYDNQKPLQMFSVAVGRHNTSPNE